MTPGWRPVSLAFSCGIWPHVPPEYRFGLDPAAYFQVRVYYTAEAAHDDYRRIARRYTDRPATGEWRGVVLPTYRGNGERLKPLRAILFLVRGWATGEVISHEAVHVAAIMVRGIALARSGSEGFGRVELGNNCKRAEERFAYIMSSAVRGITDGLYKTGVWTE